MTNHTAVREAQVWHTTPWIVTVRDKRTVALALVALPSKGGGTVILTVKNEVDTGWSFELFFCYSWPVFFKCIFQSTVCCCLLYIYCFCWLGLLLLALLPLLVGLGRYSFDDSCLFPSDNIIDKKLWYRSYRGLLWHTEMTLCSKDGNFTSIFPLVQFSFFINS